MTRWKREIKDPVIRDRIDGMRGDRYVKTGSDHIFSEFKEFAWMRGRMRALFDTGYGANAYGHYWCETHNRLKDMRLLPPVPLP